MSAEIDERVVSMKFDNGQFEQGVSKTMGTLDKFKKSLNFDGLSKGIDTVKKSIDGVSFDGMAKGAETVSIKFNAMAAAGYAAISRIVDKAMSAGEQLVKSLSIDQIAAGWSKYEQKTESVQTIMAATGEDIGTVNEQLEKLLWFADETSYSFTDMTNGIGKFTSNGQDLEKSVKAMQGISTWAAISGQKAETASRAIYNIAQAIGIGYMGVADWKSIELANMATADFKQNVIDTAVNMGKLQEITDATGKKMYKSLEGKETFDASSMRESLKDKWFDSEVMIEVLNKYGGYSDKLGQIYKDMGEDIPTSKIIADIENIAKGQKTSVEYSKKSKKMMDELAKEWDDVGAKSFAAAQMAKTFSDAIDATKDAASTAWMNLFENIFGNFEEAKVTWTQFANDLWEVFVPGVNELSDLIGEAFNPNTDILDKIEKKSGMTSDAILENIKAVGTETGMWPEDFAKSASSFSELNEESAISAETLAKALDKETQRILGTDKKLKDLTDEELKELGVKRSQVEWLQKYSKKLKSGNADLEEMVKLMSRESGRDMMFDSIHNSLMAIVGAMDLIKQGWANILPADSETIYGVLEKIKEFTQGLLDSQDKLSTQMNLKKLGEGFASLAKIIGTAFSKTFEAVKILLGGLGITGDSLSNIAGNIGSFITSVSNTFEKFNLLSEVATHIASVFRVFREMLSGVSDRFKEAISMGNLFGTTLYPMGEKLKNTWGGVKAVFSIIGTILSRLIGVVAKFISALVPSSDAVFNFADGFLSVTSRIGEFLMTLDDAIKDSKVFETITGWITAGLEKLRDVISLAMDGLSSLFNKVTKNKGSFENMSGGIQTAADALNEFGKSAQEAFDKFKAFNVKAFGKIGEFFTNLWETIKKVASAIYEFFKPAIDKLKESFQNLDFGGFLNALNAFQALFNGSLLSGILMLINRGLKGFSDFGSKLSKNSEKLKDSFKGILDSISGSLKAMANEINSQAIMNIAISVAILAGTLVVLAFIPVDRLYNAAAVIVGFVTAITVAFQSLMKMMKQSSGITGGITSILDAFAFNQNMSAMLKMAAAVAIVGGVVAVLALLPTEKAYHASFIISGLLWELIGAMQVIGKNNGTFNKASIAFVIIGKALMNMAVAVAILGLIPTDRLIPATIAITVMLGALVGAFMALQNAKASMLAGAGAIMIISQALILVAAALAIVGAIPTDRILPAVLALTITLGAIIAFMEMMPKDVKILAAAGALILMSIGLAALGGALAIFAAIPQDRIAQGLIAMGIALAEIVIAIRSMPRSFVMMGPSLLMVAVSIAALGGAVAIFAAIPSDKIAQGLIALGAALGMIAIASNAMKGAIKGAAGLLIAAAAVMVLTAALTGLVILNATGGLIPSIIALAAAFTVLGVAAGVIGPMAGALLKVAAAAAVFGVAMALIGAGVLMAATGFSIFIGALLLLAGVGSAAAAAIGENIKIILTSVAAAIPEVVGYIGDGIVVLLQKFQEIMPEIGKTILSLINTILNVIKEAVPNFVSTIIELIINILTQVRDNLPTVINLLFDVILELINGISARLPELIVAVVNLLMSVFEGAAKALQKIDLTYLVQGMAAIGLFGALMAELALVAGLAPLAMIGVLAMAGIIAELQLCIPGLVAFSAGLKAGGFDGETVNSAAMAMLIIAAVANNLPLSGGLLQQVIGTAPSLKEFAEDMANMAPALVSFSNELEKGNFNGDVTKKGAEAIKMIALAAQALPKHDGVWQQFAGDSTLTSFAKEMNDMAPALVDFSNTLSQGNFKGKAVEAGAKAIELLAAVADKLPDHDGLVQKFTGDSTLTSFAKEMNDMAPALVDFSNTLSKGNFSGAMVSMGAMAVGMLAEVANNLPKHDGVAQVFTGDSTLTDFAMEMLRMAPALVGFSALLKAGNFDGALVTSAASAALVLAKTADNLPKHDGVAQAFAGDTTLTEFSKELASMAPALVTFSKTLSEGNFNGSIVSAGAKAAEIVSEVAKNLPTDKNTVAGWWCGTTTLKDFGDMLPPLAKSLVEFSSACRGLDLIYLDKGVKATSMLQSLADAMPEKDSVAGFFAGGNKVSIEDFGKMMVSFIESFGTMQTAISQNGQFDSAKLDKILTGIEAISKLAKTVTATDTDSLNSFTTAMQNIGDAGISDFITSFANHGDELKKCGEDLINNIMNGASNKEKYLKDKLKQIILNSLNSVKDIYENMKNIGKYVVSGLIVGMQDKQPDLKDQAKKLGKTINETVQEETQVHSPSRFAMWIGENYTKGLCIGLNKYSKNVKDSAKKLGLNVKSTKEVMDAMTTSIAKVVNKNSRSIATNLKKIGKDGVSEYQKAVESAYKSSTYFVKDSAKIESDMKKINDLTRERAELIEKETKLTDDYQKAIKALNKEDKKTAEKKRAKLDKQYTKDRQANDDKLDKNQLALNKATNKLAADKEFTKTNSMVAYYNEQFKKGSYNYASMMSSAIKDTISTRFANESSKKAVASYIETMYKQDEAYKQSTNAVNNYKKEMKTTYAQIEKSEKKIAELSKSTKKADKTKLTNEQKKLKEYKKQYAKLGKLIDKESGKIVEKSQSILGQMWIDAFDGKKVGKATKAAKEVTDKISKAFNKTAKDFGSYTYHLSGKALTEFKNNLREYYKESGLLVEDANRQAETIAKTSKYAEKYNELIAKRTELTKTYKAERDKLIKAGNKADSDAVKKLKKEYDADKKKIDEKVSSAKTNYDIQKKLQNANEAIVKNNTYISYYQKKAEEGAFKIGSAVASSMSKITENMKLKDTAKTAVLSYINALYEESDAYEDDKNALMENQLAYDELGESIDKLKKKYNNLIAKGKLKKAAEIAEQLAEAQASYIQQGKALEDQTKQIEENTKSAFEEVWSSVNDGIKDGLNILKKSLDSGIKLINSSFSSVNVDLTSGFQKSNPIDILSNSLLNNRDLFSKFESNASQSTKSLIRNMESQISGATQLKEDLANLASLGLGDDAIKVLEDMGDSAAGYIKVFKRMSSDQIASVNSYFKQSNQIAINEMMDGIKKSLNSLTDWETDISKVAAKGLNSEIIKTIRENGVDNRELLDTYLKLDSTQISEINKAYEEARKKNANYNKDQFLNSIQQTASDIAKWNADIKSLIAKGSVSDEWIKKIQEAGPETRDILDAFLSMTASEIQTANATLTKQMAASAEADADALIKSLEKQFSDHSEYKTKLAKLLENESIGSAMKKELSTLTMSDLDTINAYLNMTDAQLKHVSELYEKEVKVSKETLLSNYKKDTEDYKKWAADLTSLGDLGDGMIAELAQMGMEGSQEYIAAFKQMTPEERAEVRKAFEEKTNVAEEIIGQLVTTAANNSSKVGKATVDGLATGLSDKDANKNLTDASTNAGNTVGDTLASAATDATKEGITEAAVEGITLAADSKEVKKAAKKVGKAVADGIAAKKESIVKAMADNLAAVLTDLEEKRKDFKLSGKYLGRNIKLGIDAKKEDMVASVNSASEAMITALTEKRPAFKSEGQALGNSIVSGIDSTMNDIYNKSITVGTNLVDGFRVGIENNDANNALLSSMRRVMRKALQAARDEAGIHSPSKVAAEMGRFIDLGLAQGLTTYSGIVEESATTLAGSTLSGISSAISKITEMVENDIDSQPVIRPVLDLTDVHNGMTGLNTEIQNGLNLNGSVNQANGLANRINTARANQTSTADALENLRMSLSGTDTTGSTTIENTFNITGDNPREIANQVSRILQQQVERRGATWA